MCVCVWMMSGKSGPPPTPVPAGGGLRHFPPRGASQSPIFPLHSQKKISTISLVNARSVDHRAGGTVNKSTPSGRLFWVPDVLGT